VNGILITLYFLLNGWIFDFVDYFKLKYFKSFSLKDIDEIPIDLTILLSNF
jgi:hypothetical protein